MKILVTGFSPFPGAPLNPSQLVVKEFVKSKWKPSKKCSLDCLFLETSYRSSKKMLKHWINNKSPDAIIQLGLKAGAKKICLERKAHNKVSTLHKDAKGLSWKKNKIQDTGPDVLKSTLPLKKILNRLLGNKIPAEISGNAGDYVCNFSMYTVLNEIAKKNKKIIAGFIHIPYTKSQLKQLKHFDVKTDNLVGVQKKTLMRSIKLVLKEIERFLKHAEPYKTIDEKGCRKVTK